MPEGDTIHNAADRLRTILDEEEILAVDGRYPERLSGLLGARAGPVEAVGKHLLIGFDDGTTLRTHLGMKGTWAVAPGESPRPRDFDRVGLYLESQRGRAVCRFPKVVDRFPTRERPTHPVLSRLGPDLMREDVDLDEVVARARERALPGRTVGEVLLDQRAAAGIGNVYRSEVLYIERVHPFVEAAALDDDTLRRLYAKAAELLRRNRGTWERNTTGSRRVSLFVYGAGRRGCGRCGQRVRSTLVGDPARFVWWCERCLRRKGAILPP